MSGLFTEKAHLDLEFHPLRFIRPCPHYIRPVRLSTRFGLLIGRRWCLCYSPAANEAYPAEQRTDDAIDHPAKESA